MAGNNTSRKSVASSVVSRKGVGGRPTVMTEATLNKLNEAFAFGASDKEACYYADISHQTLYDHQKRYPEFIERKEALKERPILLARRSVIRGIEADPALALKYLERKLKSEFSLRTETTGKDGEAQQLTIVTRKHDDQHDD